MASTCRTPSRAPFTEIRGSQSMTAHPPTLVYSRSLKEGWVRNVPPLPVALLIAVVTIGCSGAADLPAAGASTPLGPVRNRKHR